MSIPYENNLFDPNVGSVIRQFLPIPMKLRPFFEERKENLNWDMLSKNPNAIHLLEANPEEIDWGNLSRNPNAIDLLEANPEEINWYMLSENPNAIHLLEANPEEIDWKILSRNPSIFEPDYETFSLYFF